MKPQEGLTPLETTLLNVENNSIIQVIRAAASQLPYVSGIDNLYAHFIKPIEEKNLLIYLENFIKRELDKKIAKEIANEKQWDLLIRHSIIQSLRCSRRKQITKIIDILQGTYEGKIDSFDDAEHLIYIISELSENEAIILETIYHLGPQSPTPDYLKPGETGAISHKVLTENTILEALPEFSETLASYLGRLVGKGLLKENVNATIGDLDGSKKYSYTKMGSQLFDLKLNKNSSVDKNHFDTDI